MATQSKLPGAGSSDNPVEWARHGGKPTVAVFSSGSCCGADRMRQVLEAVAIECGPTISPVHIEARIERDMLSRYRVESDPCTLIFDKNGKEVFREEGFLPVAYLEARLEAVGVK
jgi:hypothetical protein